MRMSVLRLKFPFSRGLLHIELTPTFGSSEHRSKVPLLDLVFFCRELILLLGDLFWVSPHCPLDSSINSAHRLPFFLYPLQVNHFFSRSPLTVRCTVEDPVLGGRSRLFYFFFLLYNSSFQFISTILNFASRIFLFLRHLCCGVLP